MHFTVNRNRALSTSGMSFKSLTPAGSTGSSHAGCQRPLAEDVNDASRIKRLFAARLPTVVHRIINLHDQLLRTASCQVW